MCKRQSFISDEGEVVYIEVGLNYIDMYDAANKHIGIIWLYEKEEIKRAENISSYEDVMQLFSKVKLHKEYYEKK